MLKKYGQILVYKIIEPLIGLLIKLGITPNMITSMGLILNFVAMLILIYGAEYGARNDYSYVGWAGFTILLAGLFDSTGFFLEFHFRLYSHDRLGDGQLYASKSRRIRC